MRETHNHSHDTNEVCSRTSVSRRDFIRTAAIGVAGATLAGSQLACSGAPHAPRQGLGNMFMEGDKPLLVVVEGTDLSKMLDAGLDAIGGLDKLVAGKTVVMKPNIVSPQPPPATTAVDLTVAVAEHARTAGANSVTVCDACDSGATTGDKFKRLGFVNPLASVGAKVDSVDFSDRLAHVFVQKEGWRSFTTIGVVKTLYDAGVVINLPMIKRHEGARFTCTLKNHFGSVYFPLRQVAHTKHREGDAGQEFFDRALAEFADSVRPELNIVDGRQLLIRGGPSLGGKAEIKPGVNRIILCGDMLATDVYCSRLMEEYDDTYSHDMISTQLKTAEELGIGVGDLNNVVIKEIIA